MQVINYVHSSGGGGGGALPRQSNSMIFRQDDFQLPIKMFECDTVWLKIMLSETPAA